MKNEKEKLITNVQNEREISPPDISPSEIEDEVKEDEQVEDKQVPDEKANMVGQLVRTNLDQKNVANQHLYKILP